MGRPKIEINPAEVYGLILDGAKIVEVAEIFGVDRDTISERFSAEIRKAKFDLKQSLRRAQIVTAKQGNPTMLIWLGKQLLGQSDATIDDYLNEAIATAGLTKEDLLDLIKNREALNRAKGEKTFVEFCASAGYPEPFAKQIEMMTFVIDLTEPRLLLGSRGYGKTEYAVILGIAYELYLEHMRDEVKSTNLIVTKSKERNAAMLSEIQSACMKNGVVFDRASATRLRVRGLQGKDHSVSAVTIKTVTLRGRHPKRVIMDDPVTEDDTAEAARTLARSKFNEIMKLTKNVCVIGQPAHQYDLYADLRGEVATMEVPFGTIKMLDHDLTAMKIAGVSMASISMSYHLKVLSEGTTPFDGVKYVDTFPVGVNTVAFIDPSGGLDYTAITIMRAYMDGVVVVGFNWKKAWNHCLDDIVPLLRKYNVGRIAFETNMTGDQPIELLQNLLPGIGVVGWRSIDNKQKAIANAGAFAHLIHLSKESAKTYLDHVVKYEYKSKFDDAPDSLARCLQWLGLVRIAK